MASGAAARRVLELTRHLEHGPGAAAPGRSVSAEECAAAPGGKGGAASKAGSAAGKAGSAAAGSAAAFAAGKKGKATGPIVSPSEAAALVASGQASGIVETPCSILPEGVLFPQFPWMQRDFAAHGEPPMLTYSIAGGRRMTFVKDRELFKAIFFPDKEHLTSNQEVLAHHWFGIEKELSMDYTEQGLINTRKALKQSKARRLNDTVARGIEAQLLRDFGGSGEAELMDFAWLTFWPVNEAMFGAETVSPAACPLIREQLETYNSSFEQVANGVPRAAFPEMEAAAVAMSSQFASAIDQGFAERDGCPVLQARVSAIKREDSRWSSLHKGRFVMSVFWAAQANTVPGTFWALALCLADPAVAARCRAEARGAFAQQPDAKGEYDIKVLPYLQAVVKETLRLKVANITHRKAQKEFVLRGSDAKQLFRVRRGDTLTVCSHLNHFDPAVFPEPGAFRPERWLDGREKEMPPNSFFPFGGGPNTCSGKFLAMQEMAVLLGIFFRDYDAELIDPLPQEEWENVVAMVTPKKGQHCRVRYTRINKS